jgi:hypothetical protein
MPTGCIKKDSNTAYCGSSISSQVFAFDHAQRAVDFYDMSTVKQPNPNRLWACAACVVAYRKKEKESSADSAYMGLTGPIGGTR